MNLKNTRNKETNASFIIQFFRSFDVTNPLLSQVDFSELRLWNQAPTNLKYYLTMG
jgi:hypothetical protein